MNETSGTRYDSQSSNHLADNNSVAATAGKQGNAAQIVSASSKYLSANDNDSLSMGPGARMTVGAWVYLTSSSASKNIIAKRSYNPGNYEYFLRYEAYGSPQFAFYISRNGSNEYGTNLFYVLSNGAVPLNTWIFVAAGYDGSNIWISVNGGPRVTTPYTADIYNGTSPLAIGAAVDPLLGTPQFEMWDGSIDEAFVYKRSLGQNELAWLYNSGAGRSYADVSSPPTLSGITYTYDPVHKHAVASTDNGTPSNPNDDNTYTYDANGNMTCRVEGGTTYKQDFNIENQLTAVSIISGGCNGTVTFTTSFVYDGDGNLVKKIKPDTSKTIYVGGMYEEDRSSSGSLTHTRVYYSAGGAMRIDGTLYFVLRDHLGSASVVTNASGTTLGEQRYYPFGETRFTSVNMYTDKLYTGQRDTGLGIYYYNARFYSPYINHFISADTVVQSYANPQGLNRYSYVTNNPMRYTDPTGHRACESYGGHDSCLSEKQVTSLIKGEQKARKERSDQKNRSNIDLVIGLNQNSCTSNTCSYADYYLYSSNQSPRSPDYYNFTSGFSVPGLGAIVSLAPTVSLDRFGNVYGGVGVSFGPEAPFGVSPSLTGGWISDGPPTEKRSEKFLSGVFINASGGAGPGGGWNWNPINGGHSWEGGAYWPQASATIGGTIYYDAHRSEPLWGP